MTYTNPKSNGRSGSTTWTPRPDRMRPARREAPASSTAKPTFRGVARRDSRERLDMQLRFRGGAEAWILVEARGRVQAFPGHMSIYDVLMVINGRSHHSAD